MKQETCEHGLTKSHPTFRTGMGTIKPLSVCPGPLELKVEAITTKEGDAMRKGLETK